MYLMWAIKMASSHLNNTSDMTSLEDVCKIVLNLTCIVNTPKQCRIQRINANGTFCHRHRVIWGEKDPTLLIALHRERKPLSCLWNHHIFKWNHLFTATKVFISLKVILPCKMTRECLSVIRSYITYVKITYILPYSIRR